MILRSIKTVLNRAHRYACGLYFDIVHRTYSTDGLEFEVPRTLTSRSFRSRFVLGRYETEEERRFVRRYLDPDDVPLELGGCLGVLSCFSNRILENPTNHVVVEANPRLISTLRRNRDRNGCKFQIENCVISRDESEKFFLHDLIIGGSLVRETDASVEIPGRAISDLEEEHGCRFNALIMDIEGGELAFLKGFRGQLDRFHKVFLEVHPFADILSEEEAHQCEVILREQGFTKVASSAKNFYQVWLHR